MAVFPFWRKLSLSEHDAAEATLDNDSITSTGIGVLFETMEQSSHRTTDIDLGHNRIGNEGVRLLARSLGNNALPNA
jgi:hypothetical protein